VGEVIDASKIFKDMKPAQIVCECQSDLWLVFEDGCMECMCCGYRT